MSAISTVAVKCGWLKVSVASIKQARDRRIGEAGTDVCNGCYGGPPQG